LRKPEKIADPLIRFNARQLQATTELAERANRLQTNFYSDNDHYPNEFGQQARNFLIDSNVDKNINRRKIEI